MKFICEKDELVRAVSLAGRLSTTRATLPILQNLYLEAKSNNLIVKATDLEQTIQVIVSGTSSEKGSITIPARLLVEYLQNNNDKNISLISSDTSLKLNSEQHSASIKGLAAEDYPSLPELKGEDRVSLSSQSLTQGLNQTLFATALDDSRPILNGMLWRFKSKKLEMVATDGYRLSRCQIAIDQDIERDLIIPKRSLQELLRLLDSEVVEVLFTANQVRFVIGKTELTSRILDGSFPDYQAILPKTQKLIVTVKAAELHQSLKLASLFSRDSAYSTKMQIEKNKLTITAVSAHLGENSNTISLDQPVDEPFSISLNAQYLLEAVALSDGDVLLALIDQKSPIVVKLPNNQDFLYLLMPLRNE